MKKSYFLFTCVLFLFLFSHSALSNVYTELSLKASGMSAGMSRSEVISLLGPPSWAVIKGDTGKFTIEDPNIHLVLYWKNGECSPVIVRFDSGLKVSHWEDGSDYCGKDAHLFEPSDEYSCSKPDRTKQCQ